MLKHCCRDLLPFSHKSISEVGHWCWVIRPDSHSAFQFIPRVFDRVHWGHGSVQASQVLQHQSQQNISVFTCTGALWCWNGKGPSPNCCHKVGSTESFTMSLNAVALRFPITGTTGPSLNDEKNNPRPLFLSHQILQLALWIRTGSIILASAKSRLVRRTARWWCVIHHSREHISTVPEYNGGGALHHSSRYMTLRMMILCLHHTYSVIVHCRTYSWTGWKFNKLNCWKDGILWRCHIESHWALQ